jgi:hypothetical protein
VSQGDQVVRGSGITRREAEIPGIGDVGNSLSQGRASNRSAAAPAKGAVRNGWIYRGL